MQGSAFTSSSVRAGTGLNSFTRKAAVSYTKEVHDLLQELFQLTGVILPPLAYSLKKGEVDFTLNALLLWTSTKGERAEGLGGPTGEVFK